MLFIINQKQSSSCHVVELFKKPIISILDGRKVQVANHRQVCLSLHAFLDFVDLLLRMFVVNDCTMGYKNERMLITTNQCNHAPGV